MKRRADTFWTSDDISVKPTMAMVFCHLPSLPEEVAGLRPQMHETVAQVALGAGGRAPARVSIARASSICERTNSSASTSSITACSGAAVFQQGGLFLERCDQRRHDPRRDPPRRRAPPLPACRVLCRVDVRTLPTA
jgi:hypothetical protein